MGKLNKVPYWKCLNITSAQPDVIAEIEDWHQAMGSGEKVAFYLRHFRAMGLVPDDNAPVPGYMFKEAFRSYFKALNLPYDGKFSLKLMRAHFDANQDQILPAAMAAMEDERRLRLEIKVKLVASPNSTSGMTDRGQTIFNIFNNTDSFVYCFLQDEKKAVMRVFPNPWQPQALIPALQTLALPRSGSFNVISHPKIAQSISCYTTRKDVTAQLPALLTGQGLAAIRGVNEIAGITAQFAALAEEFRESNVEFKGAEAAVFAKAPQQTAKK